jgi:hypothetical protein
MMLESLLPSKLDGWSVGPLVRWFVGPVYEMNSFTKAIAYEKRFASRAQATNQFIIPGSDSPIVIKPAPRVTL